LGKKKIHVWFVTAAAVINALVAFAIAIVFRDIWTAIIVMGCISFGLYGYYVMRTHKKQPRYPLVPPEGKADIYLPRTDIPRPIYADLRRMKEERKGFRR